MVSISSQEKMMFALFTVNHEESARQLRTICKMLEEELREKGKNTKKEEENVKEEIGGKI